MWSLNSEWNCAHSTRKRLRLGKETAETCALYIYRSILVLSHAKIASRKLYWSHLITAQLIVHLLWRCLNALARLSTEGNSSRCWERCPKTNTEDSSKHRRFIQIHPDSSRFMIFPTWPRILLSHGYPRVSTSRWCPSETSLLPSFPLPQDANVRSMTSTGELENSSSTPETCQRGGARLSTAVELQATLKMVIWWSGMIMKHYLMGFYGGVMGFYGGLIGSHEWSLVSFGALLLLDLMGFCSLNRLEGRTHLPYGSKWCPTANAQLAGSKVKDKLRLNAERGRLGEGAMPTPVPHASLSSLCLKASCGGTTIGL